MEELLQAQLNAQRAGVSYAVVTIAEASGSVPRTSGKMLVYADGHSLGTIGGGPAERRAKADAQSARPFAAGRLSCGTGSGPPVRASAARSLKRKRCPSPGKLPATGPFSAADVIRGLSVKN